MGSMTACFPRTFLKFVSALAIFMAGAAFLPLSAPAQTATVVGSIHDVTDAPYGGKFNTIQFTPTNCPQQIGTNTYWPQARTALLTNGVFTVNLVPGFYYVGLVGDGGFGQVPKTARMIVPPGATNTLQFNDCANLASNVLQFSWATPANINLTNSDTRPIHFDDVLNVGNSTNLTAAGVLFSVASLQLFNTNVTYAFGYPYLTGYTNDGLGIQSGWDASSDGNIFGFTPPYDTNYSGWNGVSVGRGYKVIKSRIVGSSFRNGVASYGTPFLKFEQNVFAPGYPSFVASYTPFVFYKDIQLEGSNIWVSTGYAGGPSQGVQFVFTDYATYTNYFPIGEDGKIPATALRTTNSPQNGWALRYTTNSGGSFYWAP